MPEEYCKKCGERTPHKVIGEGSGNTELECLKCGNRKFLMQSFDIELM